MKAAKTMTILMGILFFSITAIQGAPEERGDSGNGELQVLCSPELEGLANQLASAYRKENSELRIKVMPIPDIQVYGALKQGTIALVNKNCLTGNNAETCFKLVVGREAIIPIMNAGHPQRDLILKQGISPEGFRRIFTSQGTITWGEVLANSDVNPVHAYTPGGACARTYLAEFISTESGNLSGSGMMEADEMLTAIAGDPYALGFCSLACLMNAGNEELDRAIGLVPVDADGDGHIGTFENIYTSSSMLSHSIFVGRFPRKLYSSIYALSKAQPVNEPERAFLEWLVNDGQEVLVPAGIMELGYAERNSRMEQLSGQERAMANVQAKTSPAGIYLVVGGFFILLGFLVYALARITGRSRLIPEASFPKGDGTKTFPDGLFFDRSHTWAFMEKNGWVRIGLDNFLPQISGPVTRVVIKQPGERIKRGEHFLTLIQEGKRLEINSPLSGIIREQNEDLLEDASLLNSDPYATGWVLMLEPLNWLAELKSFFMGQTYTDWLKKEGIRLKAFFTSVLNLENSANPELVLQDGGEIRDGVLESFGPELWQEFQEGFINTAK